MQASGNIGFNVFSLPQRRAVACERLCYAFCSAMRVNLPAERRQTPAQTEQLKPADGQGSQKEKTTITHPETRQVLPLGNSYKYDQLNRLKESKSFSNINLSSNTWGNAGSYDNKYYNAFTYDANGNILTQVRHDSVGTKIDELTYRYQKNFAGRLLKNRLYLVNDAVSSSLYGDDIDDMGTFDNNVNTINSANNYSYDGEGRLVKDKQEEIDTIIWRVDGKVSAIRRTSGSLKKNLVFDYDAFGRRTAKHVYTANDELVSSTYYVLDAGGNVMSTYQLDIDDENSSLSMYQNEKYIYGSSRLGMLKDSVNVLGSAYTDTDTTNFSIKLGNKRYELSNHLGNVLSVISDKPIPHDDGSGNADYWQADILSSYDYSPFGVMLTGRTFEKEELVQVCHNETTLTTVPVLEEGFGSWFTWTTMGSALLTYVNGEMQVSNPSNSSNNIGASKTFTTGSGVHSVSFDIIDNTCATVVLWPPSVTPKTINVYIRDNANNVVASGAYTTAGNYSLSFTPATTGATYKIEFYMASSSAFCYYRIDDVLITYQSEETTQVCENVSKKGSYPRGFNGQLKDDQVSGKGNSYVAEFWQYSPRLGKRWNLDPKPNPSMSNYAAFANNPIWYTDRDGDTIKIAYKDKTGLKKIFEKNKYIVYTPGMEYTGNNQFVSNAVNSLNYVYKNNADVHGIIEKSAESTNTVKVKKGNSDHYDYNKRTITWSTKGMEVSDKSSGKEVLGRQSGALGLFHELGHFYRHAFMFEDVKRDFNNPDEKYDDVEERKVIVDYETPAAIILQSKGYNEGTRDNHGGFPLKTISPTSTQTKKEIKSKAR